MFLRAIIITIAIVAVVLLAWPWIGPKGNTNSVDDRMTSEAIPTFGLYHNDAGDKVTRIVNSDGAIIFDEGYTTGDQSRTLHIDDRQVSVRTSTERPANLVDPSISTTTKISISAEMDIVALARVFNANAGGDLTQLNDVVKEMLRHVLNMTEADFVVSFRAIGSPTVKERGSAAAEAYAVGKAAWEVVQASADFNPSKSYAYDFLCANHDVALVDEDILDVFSDKLSEAGIAVSEVSFVDGLRPGEGTIWLRSETPCGVVTVNASEKTPEYKIVSGEPSPPMPKPEPMPTPEEDC